MDLIDVKPRDFIFIFGVSLTELKRLKLILDNSQFNYDGKNPEHLEAKKYLEEKYYPGIVNGLKSIENMENPYE